VRHCRRSPDERVLRRLAESRAQHRELSAQLAVARRSLHGGEEHVRLRRRVHDVARALTERVAHGIDRRSLHHGDDGGRFAAPRTHEPPERLLQAVGEHEHFEIVCEHPRHRVFERRCVRHCVPRRLQRLPEFPQPFLLAPGEKHPRDRQHAGRIW